MKKYSIQKFKWFVSKFKISISHIFQKKYESHQYIYRFRFQMKKLKSIKLTFSKNSWNISKFVIFIYLEKKIELIPNEEIRGTPKWNWLNSVDQVSKETHTWNSVKMRIFTYFNVQRQKHRVIGNKMNREEVTSSFPHPQYHTFHHHHLQVEIHSKSHEPTNFLKKNSQNLWNQDSMNIKRNGFIFGAKFF